MKILFVHYGDDWLAGSEIALLEMIRGLRRQDIAPFLWCNAPALERAALEAAIPVWRDPFAHYFDYSSPPFSLGGYLRLVRRAKALIAETGAELVHCNSAAPAQWMAPACRRTHTPWLINMHSPYLRRSRYVLGMHLADEIVAVSSAIAAPLLVDGMANDRIRVIHNGFDEAALMEGDATGLRAQLKIPADAIVMAIAGSLIRRKGHDILFAAMRLLPKLPLHVLVIGNGPERASLEAGAAGLSVHFLGRRDDIGPILRDAADFLVAPSRQEAFGRVIVEAAFAGSPAIGSDVDGIPEAIEAGVTGLLVPPEMPTALADAIVRLASDRPLRLKMGEAARIRARQAFTIDRCAGQMADEYRRLLSLPPPRRIAPYRNLLLGRGARG